jgi:hypothetical protein
MAVELMMSFCDCVQQDVVDRQIKGWSARQRGERLHHHCQRFYVLLSAERMRTYQE